MGRGKRREIEYITAPPLRARLSGGKTMAGFDKFTAGERIVELRSKHIRFIYFDGATLSVVTIDGPVALLSVDGADRRRLLG